VPNVEGIVIYVQHVWSNMCVAGLSCALFPDHPASAIVIQEICDGLATAVIHKDVIRVRVKVDSMWRGSCRLHAESVYRVHTAGSVCEALSSCHVCSLSSSVSIRFPCKLF